MKSRAAGCGSISTVISSIVLQCVSSIIIIIIIIINFTWNVILAINSRAVSIARYEAGILSWTKTELEQLDRRTRKLMTMHGAHHSKADVTVLE